MKAEEIYSSSESSDKEFLAQYVGHLRVKAVTKSNSLNTFPSEEISTLYERVAELGKEVETAKEVIKNLVTQQENFFHSSMHIEYKKQNFEKNRQYLASQTQMRRKFYENMWS